MTDDIHWIALEPPGRLGTMARPRGDDWLDDEVRRLRAAGVTLVVSLLEESEESELGLEREAEACERAGLSFFSLPVLDRGVPASAAEFWAAAEHVAAELDSDARVVVHCRAGIGRSSVFASALLVLRGLDPTSALDLIESARGHPVPDTPEQREWLLRACASRQRPVP